MSIRISGNQFLWAGGVVPFEIDANDFPQGSQNRSAVEQAIAHWNANSAINLVPRTNQGDFAIFRAANQSCSSFVGRQGGQQDISCDVGAGFGVGSVIHEIGHAVGLWHEQSREDRNNFVTIQQQNIQQGAGHNFNQHINDGDDLFGYDYGSIMHYSRTAFSSNGQDTIVPTDPNAQIGQRQALSSGDILGVNSTYTGTTFLLQTGTPLHETGNTFSFLLANNGDLFAIKKSGTGTNTTEVHVLSASSNYQSFILQTGTILHETDGTWDFHVATNRDIFAIKKSGTGSGTTEIHVLSAASNYQTFALQTGTCLHETFANFDFAVAANRNVFAFKKSQTGSNSTEVHVLSAPANYQSFALQTGTILHETGANFDFLLDASSNIYAVKLSQTGTNSTEIHVISASDNYQSFVRQTGTLLHETDRTFAFALNSQGNLVAIKKSNTGTNSTEVHIIDL